MNRLVYKGQTIQGYAVDKDGIIWSLKCARRLSPSVSGNTKYPKVSLRHDGRALTVDVHRVVAETLIPIPRPKEFRASIWKMMNNSEKTLVLQAYEVNHIDHDVTNYHPSNLEWVSRKTNIEKRNDHYSNHSYMN